MRGNFRLSRCSVNGLGPERAVHCRNAHKISDAATYGSVPRKCPGEVGGTV
jgi:hypothetical protein